MNDAINSVAIIALAITAVRQQRALRRLRRDHRRLRGDHVASLVWYDTVLARRALATPAQIALTAPNDARNAR